MKKVLMLSITMKDFAGSELATLEQAICLQDLGWDITIFTLELNDPLKALIPPSISTFTLDNAQSMPKEYDLIIARQYPLLDYALFALKIRATKIYYESVGYALPQDTFPLYYRHISLVGAVSEMALKKLEEKGFDVTDAFLSTNSADDRCFGFPDPVLGDSPNRIAIVSNHVPNELLEAVQVLENKYGIKVDIYGMHHTFIHITPEILAKYSVAITIGKTAFNTTALGIPTYCYDESVTSGYVTLKTFSENARWNFAIKSNYKRKAPDEIALDLIKGFTLAATQAPQIRNLAAKTFSRKQLLQKLIDAIESSPAIDYEKLNRDYFALAEQSRTFVEYFVFSRGEIIRWFEKSNELGGLYQNEMHKYLDLCKSYETELDTNQALNQQIEKLVNSKGWRVLEILRKPLKYIKRI